jgi:hypothetical protein
MFLELTIHIFMLRQPSSLSFPSTSLAHLPRQGHPKERKKEAGADIPSLLPQIDSLGKSLSSRIAQIATKKKQLRLATLKLHRAMEDPRDIVERVCFHAGHVDFQWPDNKIISFT